MEKKKGKKEDPLSFFFFFFLVWGWLKAVKERNAIKAYSRD